MKRNTERFPEDFMFQLTADEYENLKSQFATSSWGRRKLPFLFTEQGVAMLSSVLNNNIANNVNIQIIRVFTKMRAIMFTNKDVLLKLQQLEKEVAKNKRDIVLVFQALNNC